MNFSQVNLSICQIAKTFLNRFQVSPQHCPCALKLGFTHIVRFVFYDPRTPFRVCERGIPFNSEDEAKRFCQIKIHYAVDNVLEVLRGRTRATCKRDASGGRQGKPPSAPYI